MPKNPCYNTETKTDCPKRCAGCATTCEKWKTYLIEREAVYDERSKEYRAERDYIQYIEHNVNRRKKPNYNIGRNQ